MPGTSGQGPLKRTHPSAPASFTKIQMRLGARSTSPHSTGPYQVGSCHPNPALLRAPRLGPLLPKAQGVRSPRGPEPTLTRQQERRLQALLLL